MKLFSVCKCLLSSFIIILCCLQQCYLGQSTTVRPYKFGFTIDQQQHRSEQRDERGIVMGEFGFITADGIYHVTVYATDEQGRFRILAMKSYPYESPPKTVEVMVQPKIPPKTTTAPKPLPKHNFNTVACSGCFLTNGDNKPKGLNDAEGKTAKNDVRPLTKTFPTAVSNSAVDQKIASEIPSTAPKAATPKNSNSLSKSETSTKVPPPIMDIIMQKVLPNIMNKKGQPPSLNPTQSTTLNSKANAKPSAQKPSTSSSGFDAISRSGGSSADVDGGGDLYRFKYILDYQGHSETGKRNGNKEGNYYSIGDDNVQRTIEYVANEFGFQPRVRWRKLDTNEIKSKENTLKDYEFVWFKQ